MRRCSIRGKNSRISAAIATRFRVGQVLVVTVSGLLLSQTAVAQEPERGRVDKDSTARAAHSLVDHIRVAATDAGANVDRESCHLILGFSTGHFPNDPLAGQATRDIAWAAVRDFLSDGDTVSVFAWEMGIWKHGSLTGDNKRVTGNSEESRVFIKDLFPLTAREGSHGGHDTERTVVELDVATARPSNGIIVLLTNTADSVAAANEATIGSDNSTYSDVLTHWKRATAVSPSGASAILPYVVHLPDGRRVDRSLEVVVLTRQPFSGAALATTRSYKIEPPSPKPSPAKATGGAKFPWWALALPFLGFLSYFAYRTFARPSRITFLTVMDRTKNLRDIAVGTIVFRVVGKDIPTKTPDDVVLATAPPMQIAEFYRHEKGVEIEARGGFSIDSVNDEAVNMQSTRYPITSPGESLITLSGKTGGLVGAPQFYEFEIVIRLESK